MKENLDTLENTLMHAFPAGTPSDALRDRVAGIEISSRRRTARPFRFVFATAAAAMIFGAVAFVAPKARAMSALDQIAHSVDVAPMWHMRTLAVDASGNLSPSDEMWCRNGVVHEVGEHGRLLRQIENGAVVSYRQGEPEALRRATKNNQEMLSLSGFVQQFKHLVYMKNVQVADATVDGRAATQVSVESKNEPTRIRLYADRSDRFPFLATVEARQGEEWRLVRKMEIDRNPVSPGQVALSLPKGINVVDEASATQNWNKRFSQGKENLTGDFRPVALYDVTTNAQGDVFVLYANGMNTRIGSLGSGNTVDLVDVTDDQGNHYLPADHIQGTMRNTDGEYVSGFVVDGHDVMAKLYIPAGPVTSPRKIKLSFGSIGYYVPKGFKPTGKYVTRDQMEPRRTVALVKEITPKRTSSALPAWMPFLGMALRESDLGVAENEVRAQDAIARGDGAKAETYARERIRLIQIKSAEEGQSYAMYGMYDALGQALALQGENAEAQRYYQMALDAHPDSITEDQIRRHMNQVQKP